MTANTPLVEYLNVAWRRKWHVIVPTVIGLAISLALFWKLPPTYQASATVLPNQEQVSKDLARPIVSPYLRMEPKQLNEAVKKKETLELIYRRMNDVKDGDEIDADKAAALKDAFSIDPAQGRLQFKVRHADPEYAAKLATVSAEVFVATAGIDRDEWSSKVTRFMETNAEDAQKGLEEKERAIKLFRDQHLGYLPEDANAATLALVNMRNDLTRTQADITAREQAREREDYLDPGERIDKDAPDPQTGERPSQALSRMQSELNTLLLTKTDRHPDVILKKQQIAEVVRRMQLSPEGDSSLDLGNVQRVGPTPPPPSVRKKVDENERQLLQLRAYAAKLQEDISLAEAKLQQARALEPQLAALNREKQEAETLYKDKLQKRNMTDYNRDIFFGLIPKQFVMDAPAKVPTLPVSPVLWLLAAVGAGAGLGLGLAIVIVLTLLDQSYRYAEEIQAHFEVPVIATVTRILPPDERQKPARARKKDTPAAAAV